MKIRYRRDTTPHVCPPPGVPHPVNGTGEMIGHCCLCGGAEPDCSPECGNNGGPIIRPNFQAIAEALLACNTSAGEWGGRFVCVLCGGADDDHKESCPYRMAQEALEEE